MLSFTLYNGGRKQACDSPEVKQLPQPSDVCNSRGLVHVLSTLQHFLFEELFPAVPIEYLWRELIRQPERSPENIYLEPYRLRPLGYQLKDEVPDDGIIELVDEEKLCT